MIGRAYRKTKNLYKTSTKFKITLLLIILIGLFVLTRMTPLKEYISVEYVKTFVESFGIFAPLAFIVIYAIGTVLVFPGIVLSTTGGLLFGPYFGTLYTVVGATIGASCAFLVAKKFGREFIHRFEFLHKGKLKKFDDAAGQNGFKLILFLRLIPLFPFVGINYGAGLSEIKFKDYTLATLIGIIPGSFAFNYFGGNVTNIISPQGALATALLVITFLLPTFYKKYQKKKVALTSPSQ